MSYNVFSFVEALESDRRSGAVNSKESLRKIVRELRIFSRYSEIDSLKYITSARSSSGFSTSYFFPVHRDRSQYWIEGNGKHYSVLFTSEIDPVEYIVEKHKHLMALTIECLQNHARVLEEVIEQEAQEAEDAPHPLPSIAEKPTVIRLLERNLILRNPLEKETFFVLDSMAQVVREFLQDNQKLPVDYFLRYFKKPNGSSYTKNSVAQTISRMNDSISEKSILKAMKQ